MTDLHEDLRHALRRDADDRITWVRRLIPSSRHRAIYIIGAAMWVLATAMLRLMTGPDLRLSALNYTAAVVVTAWIAGRRAGYAIACFSAAVWFVVDVFSKNPEYTHPAMAFVNATMRLAIFVLGARWLSNLGDLTTRLEEVVEERTRAMRRLASDLSDAEHRERRRLAHDIHDGFSQMLSVLKLNLAAALPEAGSDSIAGHRITDAINLVNELIQRSRTLTFDLHPAMLDHFGLVETLRHFAEQFNRQTGVELTVNNEGEPRKLSDVAANYLFRSTKELVSNAARHGNAKQIVISVYWIPTILRIVIDDDGGGFNPAEVFAPGSAKGLGLAGINERMRSFGGSLRLESSPGTGTRVVLEFPQTVPEKELREKELREKELGENDVREKVV